MAKKGRKYREAAAKIDRERLYPPTAAVGLLKETVTTTFDPSVNVAIRLGVDPRRADQNVRGSVVLPHGTGSDQRVAAFAVGPKAAEAEEAGADIVGADEIAEMIDAGNLDFDALVATPDQMGRLGRYGRVLGPRGLMPNPKTGTVTMDVGEAVRQIKAGKVDYRTDRQANVHMVLGKASFPERSLVENYGAVLDELLRVRPSAAKGRYVRSIFVANAMGPSVPVDHTRLRDLWEEPTAA